MKKYLFIITIILATSIAAQEKNSRLNLSVGSGLQGLGYDIKDDGSEHKNKFGYSLSLEYHYFFTQNWGVGIGAGLAQYGSEGILNGHTSNYSATDTDGDAYTMNVSTNKWKESQKATFVEIPVMVRYRLPLSEKLFLQAGAGVRIGFNTNAEYEIKEGNITTSGYYEQYQWTVKDKPQHGFYTNDLTGQSADLKMKTAFSGILDVSLGYSLGERLLLSAGFYGSLGLNDINDEPKNATGIVSTSGDVNTYNRLFSSGLAGSVKPFAAGIKIGISYLF